MLKLRVTDYPAGGAMAPHRHDEPSLILLLSGTYLERIHGGETVHSPGHLILYPACAVHSQQFGATGARKIVLTPDARSVEYLGDHGISLNAARYVHHPVLSQLGRRMMAEIQKDDPYTSLALEGMALELVAAFARADDTAPSAAPPKWLRTVRDAVRDSVDRKVTLNEISARVGKHPVHLAREFRRYFGETVGTYRRQLRLQRAEAMLGNGIGLTETALACGFNSHSHFCRAFKAAYGLTPSQFCSRRGRTHPFREQALR
jgi:AraC family transcriptional regulator